MLVVLLLPVAANAQIFEIFAKGSLSKNNISDTDYQLSVSGSAGLAVTLIPRVRIEGRYTNATSLQNRLVAPVGTGNVEIANMMTETSILSLGLDVDLFGDKYWMQPFIYIGAGYSLTARSYYVIVDPAQPAAYIREPSKNALSGNLGAGLRIRVAQMLSLEFEFFAYGLDLKNPNPLTNAYGSVGIRLFI